MTTLWTIPADLFAGETVAVLATGPSMNQKLADSFRKYKRIAVRRAFQLAPDADMLVALDGQVGTTDDAFWDEARDFAGMKVCGAECDDIDALYAGMFYERVTLAEGHVVEIRNNGLAAIRIAARAGASKIVLLGFDAERFEEREAHIGFRGMIEGLEQIVAELRAGGIEIEAP
jgi:hypothetical protein